MEVGGGVSGRPAEVEAQLLALPDGPCLLVLAHVPQQQLPALRLVCHRLKLLIDAALCPRLAVDEASHLGGRLSRRPIYSSRLEFTTAAARVLRQRAEGLRALVLDFGAYGCVFASALLEAQPLPQLSCVELHNAEAQHVAALRSLPRLREVCLSRRINGPVTAGPSAELLVEQLRGLPLRCLSLSGYRMLAGVLGSVADGLPGLRHLALGVESVEQHDGRLQLAGLARLRQLRSWELRLLGGRASAAEVCVAPLPPAASALCQLSSVALAHVRAAPGEQAALWSSLALLPGLLELRYEESEHSARQPPPQLLALPTLTSLHIRMEGAVYYGDPPNSAWSQLPELPSGALPHLARLHLDCVGLPSLPPSWCRLPLRELRISGLAWERSFYSLHLPDQLAELAPTLTRLDLPSCGLLALPEQVPQLTGLCYLGLPRNSVVRLPRLGQLSQLSELELCGNPATNVATALQGCRSLRRLGLGSAQPARRCLAAGEHGGAAGEHGVDAGAAVAEDVEACRWQEAWLHTVRAALPWVQQVHTMRAAQHD